LATGSLKAVRADDSRNLRVCFGQVVPCQEHHNALGSPCRILRRTVRYSFPGKETTFCTPYSSINMEGDIFGNGFHRSRPTIGRSVKGLVDLVNELGTQKVHFQSITDSIDTRTPAGRFFFHVMASLAQMERELIMERTRAGLEAARRQGRVGGRKRQITDSKVQAARKLLASGTLPQEGGAQLGCVGPHVVSLGACFFTDVDRQAHRNSC
jgi:hypothetical protein